MISTFLAVVGVAVQVFSIKPTERTARKVRWSSWTIVILAHTVAVIIIQSTLIQCIIIIHDTIANDNSQTIKQNSNILSLLYIQNLISIVLLFIERDSKYILKLSKIMSVYKIINLLNEISKILLWSNYVDLIFIQIQIAILITLTYLIVYFEFECLFHANFSKNSLAI